MISPGLLRLAIVLSSAVTGGTIYYWVSDGGDPKVAQQKAEEMKERLISESEKLHVKGVQGVEQARSMLENARTKVLETSQSIENDSTIENSSTAPNINASNQDTSFQQSNNISRHPYCHTCSGPRIWFFAERLRIKRRFTPYPDPPKD